MEEELIATVWEYPFPHLIVEDFYNEEELELIWEELKFYTKPNKLLEPKIYGGVVGYTESKAILLDNLYKKFDGEGYKPHTDKGFQFLAFSYFYKEPKKFSGGELYFPKYDYEFPCNNNSMIIFPGWVEHGVREVSIKESDYFDGNGRYAITSFFGFKPRVMSD